MQFLFYTLFVKYFNKLFYTFVITFIFKFEINFIINDSPVKFDFMPEITKFCAIRFTATKIFQIIAKATSKSIVDNVFIKSVCNCGCKKTFIYNNALFL